MSWRNTNRPTRFCAAANGIERDGLAAWLVSVTGEVTELMCMQGVHDPRWRQRGFEIQSSPTQTPNKAKKRWRLSVCPARAGREHELRDRICAFIDGLHVPRSFIGQARIGCTAHPFFPWNPI
jgi:hypothetical protein